MFTVSISSARSFQRCQQQYAYKYVDRLRRKERPAAPELGIIIHEYLEAYYRALKGGVAALEAHGSASERMATKHVKALRVQAEIARQMGEEDTALAILEMPEKAERLAERYFAARGLADANRYDILEVELPIQAMIRRDIQTRGYIDLITRDRLNGRIGLWEHKSTKNVPPMSVRLLDLQTAIYAAAVADKYEVDAVIWNYIRTREPTVPTVVYKGTKKEGMTRRSDLDSTWGVYLAALQDAVLNVEDYEDMRERLEPRELTVFFPRYEQVIVVEDMMTDYIATAREIRRAEKRWVEGKATPIRSFQTTCDWCEYLDLCRAVMMGGDVEDVIALRYNHSPRIEAGLEPVQEEETVIAAGN